MSTDGSEPYLCYLATKIKYKSYDDCGDKNLITNKSFTTILSYAFVYEEDFYYADSKGSF